MNGVDQPFWTASRVKAQSEVWRDELLPLATTELDRRLIESVTALMACMGQIQEAQAANRGASEQAAALASEVASHLRVAIDGISQRLERVEG